MHGHRTISWCFYIQNPDFVRWTHAVAIEPLPDILTKTSAEGAIFFGSNHYLQFLLLVYYTRQSRGRRDFFLVSINSGVFWSTTPQIGGEFEKIWGRVETENFGDSLPNGGRFLADFGFYFSRGCPSSSRGSGISERRRRKCWEFQLENHSEMLVLRTHAQPVQWICTESETSKNKICTKNIIVVGIWSSYFTVLKYS